jgi:hypothetical protein
MKNRKLFYVPIMAIFAFLMAACTSDKKNEAELREDDNGININVNEDGEKANIKINEDGINIDIEDGENSIKIDADNLEGVFNQLTDGKSVEVVDHRELKDLFPKKVAGMKRVSVESQKTGFGGIKSAIATAEYEDGDTRLKISVVDAGGIGLAINAMAGWTGIEIDKETENGYERTTEIDGHKAFESYDSKDEDGQIALFIKNRVLYTAEITNGSERQLKKGINAVDVDDIVKLIKKVEK